MTKGIVAAVKFSYGDTVYTYKSTLLDLSVGEIVAVSRKAECSMAAVVAVDKTLVDIPEDKPVIRIRESNVDPATITPRMRTEYKTLINRMKDPSFFRIGLPAEPTAEDVYAVSVRFMNDFTNQFSEQEYTYLTDRNDLATGDIVVVPVGTFNLEKRASVVKYVSVPEKTDIPLKRVYGRPLELSKKAGTA